MIVKRVRPGFTFRGLLALLVLVFLGSPQAASAEDPRQELIDALRGENVDGFLFSLGENDTHETASLTNPEVHDVVELGSGDPGLVLSYTSIEDKATGKANLYKAEIVRGSSSLTFVVTDLTTKQVVENRPFPTPAGGCFPPGPFESLNACLREFDCSSRGAHQCNANRTCQAQLVALTCCLKDGSAFSVHLIIRPTAIRCLLQDLTSGLEGLVFRD